MPVDMTERELGELLRDLKNANLTDKEGSYDYAFLEETIFPTLLPALVQLSEKVEDKNMPPLPPAEGQPGNPGAFNPLRSLGELLMRQHPDNVFKQETAYSKHLEKVAAVRREQRIQRELLIQEMERKEQQAALEAELERTAKEEQDQKERNEQRAKALEQKLALRAAERMKLAEDKAGSFQNVMDLRETCMSIINKFDFATAKDTAEVNALIYKETCTMLITNSKATFVGVGRLDAPGIASTLLHYHTAADKKEFEVEEEEPEEAEEGAEPVEKPPKEAPPPEITTRILPPVTDEMALVLRRGNGVTWTPVIDGEEQENEETQEVTRLPVKPYFTADTKFTEGMFFFEDKRPGTYLAVPIMNDGEVIGVICGDTLDSVIGSELQASETAVFQAAAHIMQQCLNYAEWCLLDARIQNASKYLAMQAQDPRTLPQHISKALVEAIDMLMPNMHIAVAVFETDTTMRLVYSKEHDGIKKEDEGVGMEDPRDHVTDIFETKRKRDVWYKKNDAEEVYAMAAPVVDANNFIPAVVYIAADPKGKPPHADILDFVQHCATLATPALLAPAANASRVMSVFAASGIGDPGLLFETAVKLCTRYTRAEEVFLACSHGASNLRILHHVGSKMDTTYPRANFPAADEAMRTQSSSALVGYVAVPLVYKDSRGEHSFGCIAIRSGELSVDQQKAFEGIAEALSKALGVSEFRRKMVVCAQTALESLLKRAVPIQGAYFSFCDIGGQQVCAAVAGKLVRTSSDATQQLSNGLPVEVGKTVRKSSVIQTQAVQPSDSGPIFGIIGVARADLDNEDISMYDDSAWTIMQNTATTLANVSTLIEAEGLMMDQSLPEYAMREGKLASHFSTVRFRLVTESTIRAISLKFIDQTKTGQAVSIITQKIMSAIMYILGHQQRDVSEWAKCRKLITHHLMKEMKMIDVRSLKVHKVKLAKDCIVNLDAGDIATEVGPMPLALWKWVLMILEILGL